MLTIRGFMEKFSRFRKYLLFYVLLFPSLFLFGIEFGDWQETSQQISNGVNPYAIAYSPALSNGNVFAAVANQGSGDVSIYQVDNTTGLFTFISNFSTGINPSSVAFSPLLDGDTLFVAIANSSSNTVSVFKVESNGMLSRVGDFATGSSPSVIAFSPYVDGHLLAGVTNFNSFNFTIYRVDPVTGKFEFINSITPFPSIVYPEGFAFSPIVGGMVFAAVAVSNSSVISLYFVDVVSGVLTKAADIVTTLHPNLVAFSPAIHNASLFLAATDTSQGQISAFQIYPNGTFTEVPGSPFSTGKGPIPIAYSPLVKDPQGVDTLFAAVGNDNDNIISVYKVDLITGIFGEIENSPFPTGISVEGLAYSPLLNGKLFAGAANTEGNTLTLYNIFLGEEAVVAATDVTAEQIVVINPSAIRAKKCLIDYINIIKWKAPQSGDDIIIAFRVINRKNNKVLAEIPNRGKKHFKVKFHCRNPHKTYKYAVVSVGRNGALSRPVRAKIKGK